MTYEIALESISNCPLRASDIRVGGVGKATRIIIRGGFSYPVWFSPYWGPNYIYTYPVPVIYYR